MRSTTATTEVEVLITPVFIELTDAFQMLYNGNVPMLIERAIVAGSNTNRMISVKTLKFTNPARLGDLLEVSVQPSKKGGGFTAKLVTMSSVNQLSVAIASATSVVIAAGADMNEVVNEASTDTPLPATGKIFVSCFRLWPDELGDMSAAHTALPTRTVFNLLERGRSNVLGGPQVLAQSASSALHYYVARVSDYKLSFVVTPSLRPHPRTTQSDTTHPATVQSGTVQSGTVQSGTQSEVWVKVYTTVTPIGAQLLDFDQQIVLCGRAQTYRAGEPCYTVSDMATDTASSMGKVLAQARVTVACVDAVSGGPATVPSDIQALLL